jgi:hypothetical protein
MAKQDIRPNYTQKYHADNVAVCLKDNDYGYQPGTWIKC